MTHSRFAAANSFSLLTSSVSFVSVESISHPLLIIRRYQSPEAPPPPLSPPPNPPNPPPSLPPPKPPPPQPPESPPERLPALSASIPSRNQSKPLPPDPPPRRPPPREERPPISRKNAIKASKYHSPRFPRPPPLFRIRPAGGWPLSVTPESSAMYFAMCHAA